MGGSTVEFFKFVSGSDPALPEEFSGGDDIFALELIEIGSTENGPVYAPLHGSGFRLY